MYAAIFVWLYNLAINEREIVNLARVSRIQRNDEGGSWVYIDGFGGVNYRETPEELATMIVVGNAPRPEGSTDA